MLSYTSIHNCQNEFLCYKTKTIHKNKKFAYTCHRVLTIFTNTSIIHNILMLRTNHSDITFKNSGNCGMYSLNYRWQIFILHFTDSHFVFLQIFILQITDFNVISFHKLQETINHANFQYIDITFCLTGLSRKFRKN